MARTLRSSHDVVCGCEWEEIAAMRMRLCSVQARMALRMSSLPMLITEIVDLLRAVRRPVELLALLG